MKKDKITIGTILGVIGFLLPQAMFIYNGDTPDVTIWVALAFLYTIGYIEYPILFGTENDWGFHLLNPNWYLDPSEIADTLNFYDVDFYIQAFETFLYGGDYNSSSLDMSGVIFIGALICGIIAIVFGIFMRKGKLAGVLFLITGILTIVSLLMTWNNAISQPWLGSAIRDSYLPLPIGSVVLIIAGVLNLKSK